MSKLLKVYYSRYATGLRLGPGERATLRRARIYADSRVELIRQPGGRYLIYGKESGGGAVDVGHYCGFIVPNPDSFALFVNVPVQLDRNGLHRRVYGSELVRYELFLFGEGNVHFMVTRFAIDQSRHLMRIQNEFVEYNGKLTKNSAVFFSPQLAVEIPLPRPYRLGFRAALEGSRTFACKAPVFAKLAVTSATNPVPPQNETQVADVQSLSIVGK